MYGVKYCSELQDLRNFIEEANRRGYEITAMTEGHGYTILYKRIISR